MPHQYASTTTYVTPEWAFMALDWYVVRVLVRAVWRLGRKVGLNVERLEIALSEDMLYDGRVRRRVIQRETWPASDWPLAALRKAVCRALLATACGLQMFAFSLLHGADPLRDEDGFMDMDSGCSGYHVGRQLEKRRRRPRENARGA